MSREILYPTEVAAYRYGSNSQIVIVAKGREDGFCKIQIEASLATIYPPIYMVTGEPCAVIGDFPYTARKTVRYSTDLDYINFQMAHGTERIPIEDILETSDAPEALTSVSDNQIVGIAYYSNNIQDAIDNATDQIYKKFPNAGANMKMVDSRIVTSSVLGPFGITYYAVTFEQQS
ncbi:MAG: hypothetical protein AB8B56_07775 [Crocinitomicaceae bacterium]